jgi:hypothetical protein
VRRFAKPAEGSWTERCPELGTAPMPYGDCVSPVPDSGTTNLDCADEPVP